MLFTQKSLCNILFAAVLFLFFALTPHNGWSSPKKNYFPLFPAITDNVVFWEKVYAEYTVNTAVLHDREDLSIIYEAIPLLDKKLPGASRLNRAYLKNKKTKYIAAFNHLASGKKPVSAIEKNIAAHFREPDLRNKLKKAAGNLRIQTGLKERFIEGVIRSGAYIDEMKRIFRSYNLPEDLAYLPHVESSFNIKAYSKFGAAGMWQFTRSTGKDYLTIDYIVDERRDPIISTRAAAEYLQRNFSNLGTWPLSITAYNYGHAGMRRALNDHGKYENIFLNYSKGHFKFASKNFYSEFLAAMNVAKKLERSQTLKRDTPVKSFHINLQGYASAADLSSYYNLSLETLKNFNPSLREPVWLGEKYIPKGFQLRLPHTRNMLSQAKAMPLSLFRKHQKKSNFYTVQKGDTAGAIARRHGISLKNLSHANNLNRNSVVYIGQTLRIPSTTSQKTSHRVAAAKNNAVLQHQKLPELKEGKKSAPAWDQIINQQLPRNYDLAVNLQSGNTGAHRGVIIVQPEESIGIYTEWLKISKNEINTLNKIPANGSIHPGQKIIIPFTNTSSQEFEDLRKEFHQETEEDFFSSFKVTGFQKYQVAMGDTLWEICQKKFDLPLWLL